EIVREPLRLPAGAQQQGEIPLCRYVVLSPDGAVAQTGAAPYVGDGVFRVELRGDLVPGLYTVLLALYLNDNPVAPEIQAVQYRASEQRPTRSTARPYAVPGCQYKAAREPAASQPALPGRAGQPGPTGPYSRGCSPERRA